MSNFSSSNQATAVAHQNIPFALRDDQQVLSDDGAITLESGQVVITKAGVGAITMAVPDHDGQRIVVFTATAYAHVITQATVGFNAKGSSGTATFGAAAGNAVELRSYGGNWYAVNVTGVTIA
jgi:hypothetical protein